MDKQPTTPIAGIRYWKPVAGAVLTGLDGKVQIPCGDFPFPLLEEDYAALGGGPPSYDAAGRGIYEALRRNPDCAFAESYAQLLKDAYPHFLAELASQIVMMDKKDVDVAYLDRKVRYLKIFALIEPGNFQLLLEIGAGLLSKGMRLETVQLVTITLYQAEKFLRRAWQLTPADVRVRHHLGEVSYLLGKYEDAARFWDAVLDDSAGDDRAKLQKRLQRLAEGKIPLVPVVDYLEGIGVAFDYYQQGEFAEAVAILLDVLDDRVFREDYAVPELLYLVGSCYAKMAMPKDAESYLQEALRLNPDYAEAQSVLNGLYH
jgi:tetratricopeptide (TPR) repeat protein